jgi:hypothetical protein
MAQRRPRRGFGLGILPRVPQDEKPASFKRWAEDLLRVLDRGIEPETFVVQTTLNPAAIAANTTAEETFTVLGLTVGDFVAVSKPSATAGVGIVNARVSAADTLAITFANTTGGSLNPASELYTIAVIRGNPTT